MWTEILKKNHFIKSLYAQAPDLSSVRIISFTLEDDGLAAVIKFDIPKPPDNFPKKWIELDYNTTTVEIRFIELKRLDFQLQIGQGFESDIALQSNGNVRMTVSGQFRIDLVAEMGAIVNVTGYQNDS